MVRRTQTPLIHLTDCVQPCREVESKGTINTVMNIITALITDYIKKKKQNNPSNRGRKDYESKMALAHRVLGNRFNLGLF